MEGEEEREEESYTDLLKHPSVKFKLRVFGMVSNFKKEMNILLSIYSTVERVQENNTIR